MLTALRLSYGRNGFQRCCPYIFCIAWNSFPKALVQEGVDLVVQLSDAEGNPPGKGLVTKGRERWWFARMSFTLAIGMVFTPVDTRFFFVVLRSC